MFSLDIFLNNLQITTYDLKLPQRFKTCFKMLRHFSDVHTNRKSCRRPVVSLSHETKIVPCKSALRKENGQTKALNRVGFEPTTIGAIRVLSKTPSRFSCAVG